MPRTHSLPRLADESLQDTFWWLYSRDDRSRSVRTREHRKDGKRMPLSLVAKIEEAVGLSNCP